VRGPALSRAQDERVLLVKLGVVFRKANQRRLAIAFLG